DTATSPSDASDVKPSTDIRLKIFEPTTLPTAMSRSPRLAATTEVASSGSEVPMASTVRPIINSLTPSAVATDTAPSTSNCEPPTRPAIPMASQNRLFHKGCGSKSSSLSESYSASTSGRSEEHTSDLQSRENL